MYFPAPLRPGDTIAVFAGSSPFDSTLGWRGIGWLRSRYKIRFERGAFANDGFFAGDDGRRRAELARAMTDDGVAALLAMRGGYGLSRFAHELPWGRFAAAPRWLVGFSDVTALHVELARLGVASIHGPMVASLGRNDAPGRADLIAALEAPGAARRFEGLRALAPGRAAGPLVGGNLTVLHACAAAGRLRLPVGCVLLIEDVGERPYRLDRALSTLRAGGHLDRVAAVVAGDFTDCQPGPDGVDVQRVLAECLSPLRIPVLVGAPVGHGQRNIPVVFGRNWYVDSARGVAETSPHDD